MRQCLVFWVNYNPVDSNNIPNNEKNPDMPPFNNKKGLILLITTADNITYYLYSTFQNTQRLFIIIFKGYNKSRKMESYIMKKLREKYLHVLKAVLRRSLKAI